jgi:phage tail-like protein
MATERDNPYGSFNFLVDLGTGDTASNRAGFQEVSGLNTEITISEYRNGNEGVNHVRKVAGTYKVGDVTLKRGLIGATDLIEWVNQVRTGDPAAARNITIQLRDEAGTNTVMTWRGWTSPALWGSPSGDHSTLRLPWKTWASTAPSSAAT